MAFKLIEVERAENINDNIYRTKAVSTSPDKLKTYCKETFGKVVIDEPEELEDFPWEDYFIIVERDDLVIL